MNKTPQTGQPSTRTVAVLVHTPAYSQVAGALTYLSDKTLLPGTLVRVPLGQRELLGVVWDDPEPGLDTGPTLDPAKLRQITAALDALPLLSPSWRALMTFAASYYQRAVGEVALAALPPQLKDLSALQLARRLKKTAAQQASRAAPASNLNDITLVALTPEQARAIDQFDANPGPFLLFGATGSGKTEVFMRCTAKVLADSPDTQVLVMVPEINLTPQLEERFKSRFGAQYGEDAVVAMHSGMTPAQRLKSWVCIHATLTPHRRGRGA